MSGHYSPNSTSGQHVPILSDKYGDYVKPEQRSTKGMGSTSKKNIASGATAVIRLVRQRQGGRILAVKEFKKRGKTEAERDYQKRMLNEYCISKTASNHKHIVETLDLVKDEKNRWCVVMEYVCFLFCLIYLRLSIFTIFILTNIYIYILILVLGR
jgi:serine/threonine protein kinase